MTNRQDDDDSEWVLPSAEEDDAPGLQTRAMQARLRQRMFDAEAVVRIGGYVVVRTLGEGAMGTVLLAYDPDLDRRVAVKVLKRGIGGAGSQASSRMAREAKAMARLAHPNVVTVHEVGIDDGQVFVAMEFVEGGTLAQWCQSHPVDSSARFVEVLDLATQAARGLAAAHGAGLVHRDLKPANMLVGQGRLRIADFGLARPQGEELPASASKLQTGDDEPIDPAAMTLRGSEASDDGVRLTSTGELVGTPAYMAPEQFRGDSDERSDQFGWCATFFEACYGVRPFVGQTISELFVAVEAGNLVKTSNAFVPSWMRRLLERGLASDPAARWPSMDAILVEIGRRRGARGRRIVGGVSLVAVGVLGALAFQPTQPSEPAATVCPDAIDELKTAWGPERREAIEQAFEGTAVPYAADAWVRVERGLDGVTEDWARAKAETCRAASSDDPQVRADAARREACLDRSRQAIEFVSEQLAAASKDTVRFSAQTIAGLHDRVRCEEEILLATPEQGEDDIIDATLAELERARALRDLHRLTDAKATLEEAIARIPDEGFVRLHAQAHDTMVSVALLTDDQAALAEHATAMLGYAERSGDPGLHASAWASLALVESNASRHEEASFRIARAENLAAHASVTEGLRARIARVQAGIHTAQQQHAEAVAKRRESLEILERRAPESIEVAYALRNLADAMFAFGEGQASIEALERSLALHQRLLGPDHPDTAMAHVVLANILVRLRSDQTPKHIDEAERILRANPEYRPSGLARVHELRGLDMLSRTGEDPDEELRKAQEIFERTLGPEHSAVFHVRLFRANALQARNRRDEAAAAYRALIEQFEPGEDMPVTFANARMNLADVEAALGHAEAALGQIALARPVFEQAYGAKGPTWRGTFINMARVYRRAGRLDEATEILGRVQAAVEASEEPVAVHQRLWLQVERARTALARGRRTEAIAIARQTRAMVGDGKDAASARSELEQLEQALGLDAETTRAASIPVP